MESRIRNILLEARGVIEIDGGSYNPADIVEESPEEISKEEARNFLLKLKSLWENGGKVYRLIYVKSLDDIDMDNPGSYWTVFEYTIKESLLGYLDELPSVAELEYDVFPFVITGKIAPRKINVEYDISHFLDFPEETQIESDDVVAISVKQIE